MLWYVLVWEGVTLGAILVFRRDTCDRLDSPRKKRCNSESESPRQGQGRLIQWARWARALKAQGAPNSPCIIFLSREIIVTV